MDCCICSPMASKYRLPRNAVCAPCHEGAKAIIAFLGSDEHKHDAGGDDGRGSMKPTNLSPKGMRDAWEQLQAMRDREVATNQRAAFLEHGLALLWKEGIHTDIVLKPGTGPPIPAHRAILAARSEVFRHALSSDDERCKAPASDCDTISLPELSHDDLALFLSFLYTGALDDDELPDHRLHALLVAGDKYDVPFLQRVCEARLEARVGPGNALRTLEIAETSGSAGLKERAMDAVVEHAGQVVFTPEYEDFAVRNAGLCVEVTRALLLAKKS